MVGVVSAQAFLLWPAGPLSRVYKDVEPLEWAVGRLVEIKSARNGWEGGQFVIMAPCELHGITVKLTELKRPSGYILPSERKRSRGSTGSGWLWERCGECGRRRKAGGGLCDSRPRCSEVDAFLV